MDETITAQAFFLRFCEGSFKRFLAEYAVSAEKRRGDYKESVFLDFLSAPFAPLRLCESN
jgi:hypothetical protein